jgi:hypothetical protein
MQSRNKLAILPRRSTPNVSVVLCQKGRLLDGEMYTRSDTSGSSDIFAYGIKVDYAGSTPANWFIQ